MSKVVHPEPSPGLASNGHPDAELSAADLAHTLRDLIASVESGQEEHIASSMTIARLVRDGSFTKAERQTEIAFAMYTALRSIADFQHEGELTADVAIQRATARAALAIAEGR